MNYEKFFELREKSAFVFTEINREFLKVKDELTFIQNNVFNIDVEYLRENHKNNSIDENIDYEYSNALNIANITENKLNFLKNNYELKNYYALKAQFLRKQSEIIYNYELALSSLYNLITFYDNNIICYRYEMITIENIKDFIALLDKAISKDAKTRLVDEVFVKEYINVA